MLSKARESKIVRLYKGGKTVASIMRAVKTDPRTFYRVLQRNRVGLRRRKGQQTTVTTVPTFEQPTSKLIIMTVYKSLPPYLRRGIDRILAERARTGAPTKAAHEALNVKVTVFRNVGEAPEV